MLAYWAADDTFRASVEQRDAGEDGDNEFVFYDGPPFANGLPHYGHLLTGYVKDLVPRYQTMRGRRVERRFGWDTHGLPAELEAMRQLGIKTTDEILELGIEKFNDACRTSVMRVHRASGATTSPGRPAGSTSTTTTGPSTSDYMESVMWAFKQLYDKGLVYEGFRVLPYCWNDETPLSNHELRMDEDVYQQRAGPGRHRRAAADDSSDARAEGALALIWTTTPWTLTANLAVMVGSDIDYVVVEAPVHRHRPERVPARRGPAGGVRPRAGAPRASRAGRRSVATGARPASGARYTPPFSYYLGHARAFRVVAADDVVTTTDGTGLVHTAGAFGEADKDGHRPRGHRGGDAGRQGRQVHRARSTSTPGCRSSTPTCRSSTTSRR